MPLANFNKNLFLCAQAQPGMYAPQPVWQQQAPLHAPLHYPVQAAPPPQQQQVQYVQHSSALPSQHVQYVVQHSVEEPPPQQQVQQHVQYVMRHAVDPLPPQSQLHYMQQPALDLTNQQVQYVQQAPSQQQQVQYVQQVLPHNHATVVLPCAAGDGGGSVWLQSA
jgi:hypothetical protein